MFKKLCFFALCLFSASTLAVPIAGFDAFSEVGFSISDSSLSVEVSSTVADSSFISTGTGTGSVGGSGDLAPITPDPAFVWAATAAGSVAPFAGTVDGFSLTDGLLSITNSTASAIDFTIDFSIVLATGILTTDPLDDALAYAAAFIYDDVDTIFDHFFELDKTMGGSGSLSASFGTSKTYTLKAGDSLDIFVELDASGLAAGERIPGPDIEPVPVPATFWLFAAGLAGLGVNSRKKLLQTNFSSTQC